MTVGDTVSLLPRELGPDIPTSAATSALASSVGITWTSELLTVTGVDPSGPVSVQPNSLVSWGDGVTPTRTTTSGQPTVTAPAESTASTVGFDDLKGAHAQASRLTEWLKLALDQPQLLETLGATANLGVLVSGPAGVGKATMVRTVCADRRLVELDGPEVGALRAEDRLTSVSSAVSTVRDGGGVLLITDIDALLPSPAEPVATLILTELRTAVATRGVAFVATSALPDNVDPRLRAPELCDRELGLSLPDGAIRKQLLEVLLRDVPAETLELGEIAERTPGFVVADLAALVREAALRAAARASADGKPPAADAGRPDRCAQRHPPPVAVGHRRGVGRFGDARGRRRHGRDQAGAHRGGAVAAAASGDLRAPRRRAAARRAALRSARLRQRRSWCGRWPARVV